MRHVFSTILGLKHGAFSQPTSEILGHRGSGVFVCPVVAGQCDLALCAGWGFGLYARPDRRPAGTLGVQPGDGHGDDHADRPVHHCAAVFAGHPAAGPTGRGVDKHRPAIVSGIARLADQTVPADYGRGQHDPAAIAGFGADHPIQGRRSAQFSAQFCPQPDQHHRTGGDRAGGDVLSAA